MQHTMLNDYDVEMTRIKVETSYCTVLRRFKMVVMMVQRVEVQADHNATSNEGDILLDVRGKASGG